MYGGTAEQNMLDSDSEVTAMIEELKTVKAKCSAKAELAIKPEVIKKQLQIDELQARVLVLEERNVEQMKLREKAIVTGMLDSGGKARLLREKHEAVESKRELQRKMWDMQEQNEAWSKAFVAGEVSRDKAQYQAETERQDMLDRLDEQEIDLAEMQFMRGAQDSELGTAREGLQALHGSLHRHERQVLQLQTQGAEKDTKIGDLEGLNFELELRLEELHAVLGRTNAEVQRQHLVLEAKDAEIRRSQQFIKDRTSGRPIKGSPMMVRDVVVPTAHGGSKRRRVFSEMDHNTLAEDTDNEAVGETLWDN